MTCGTAASSVHHCTSWSLHNNVHDHFMNTSYFVKYYEGMRNYTNNKGYKGWLHMSETVGAELDRLHVWLYSVWLILMSHLFYVQGAENISTGDPPVFPRPAPLASLLEASFKMTIDFWVTGRSMADGSDKEYTSKESVSLCHVEKLRSLFVAFLIFGKEGAATVVSVSRRGCWGWIKVDLWKSHGWWNSK